MPRYPLVDLHRHLEGAVRVSTILDLARRANHPLGDSSRPRDLLVADPTMSGLLPYLDRVDAGAEVFVRPEDWTRAAREVVVDAYDDGLDALELRFSPWFIASRTRLDPLAVIDAVAEGVAMASRETTLPVGLIGILLRDLGSDSALPQLRSILNRRQHFCAIDLAGNEAGHPAHLFTPAYDLARDAGLHLTAHAGEAAGPDSVWDVIVHLRVERIGHGVRAIEDPRLVDYLAEHRIPLEVALTSNVQTGAARSLAEHPARALLAGGVRVTLNTDNPRASNVTLSHEYDIATQAGLTTDNLTAVAENTRTACFVTSENGSISTSNP